MVDVDPVVDRAGRPVAELVNHSPLGSIFEDHLVLFGRFGSLREEWGMSEEKNKG